MAWKPPWVHIDDIKIEALAIPVLINRIPSPDETGVPVGDVIQFELYNPTANSWITGSINVIINGINAVNGGVIVAPFNGVLSTSVILNSGWIRFILDPTEDMPSLSNFEVNIQGSTTDPFNLDETYTFIVQDLSSPRLQTVEPVGRKKIRVTFSQEVQETTAVSTTVLFPWGIEALTLEDNSRVLNPLSYPWVQTALSEPFRINAGTFLDIIIDDNEFQVIHPATASSAINVALGLNTVLTPVGGRAMAFGGQVYIASLNPTGSIEVKNQGSNLFLKFDSEKHISRLPYGTTEGFYTLESEAIYPTGFVSHREFSFLLKNVDVLFTLEDSLEVFDDSIINAENYTLTHDPVMVLDEIRPTYNATVESVDIISSTEIELVLKQDMTPSGPYYLTVENVIDQWGNVISPSHNQLFFRGYIPNVPARRKFDLYSFMTAFNRKQDIDELELKKFLAPMQEVIVLLLADLDEYITNRDPTLAPERAIELLLESYGNPFVWFELTLLEKRQLVRLLAQFYKRKGTEPGIEAVLRFFFGFTTIEFLYYWGGGWIMGESELGVSTELNASELKLRYTFSISVDRVLTNTERILLRQSVDVMKPSHTHFLNIMEPTAPFVPDHWQLPWSELGVNTMLH